MVARNMMAYHTSGRKVVRGLVDSSVKRLWGWWGKAKIIWFSNTNVFK